jgi:hypothetical protein
MPPYDPRAERKNFERQREAAAGEADVFNRLRTANEETFRKHGAAPDDFDQKRHAHLEERLAAGESLSAQERLSLANMRQVYGEPNRAEPEPSEADKAANAIAEVAKIEAAMTALTEGSVAWCDAEALRSAARARLSKLRHEVELAANPGVGNV